LQKEKALAGVPLSISVPSPPPWRGFRDKFRDKGQVKELIPKISPC
jgi:hypothetical protein